DHLWAASSRHWSRRLFALPKLARRGEWRDEVACVNEVWCRATQVWEPPELHLVSIQRTLAASWPAPLQFNPICQHGEPIRIPTLLLVGDREAQPNPAALERSFSGSFRLEMIAEAGRFLHLEQPSAVAHAVVDWLTTPSGPIAGNALR